MKINIRNLVVVVVFLLGSCNYLDYTEEDWFTEERIFDDPGDTKSFLTGIYSKLPDGFNEIGGSMRASASDDAEEANELAVIQAMNDGRWNPNFTIDEAWGSMYSGIRSANIFLSNVDLSRMDYLRVNDNYLEVKKEYELFDEQARFLRAFFYFELIKRYGGVPFLNGKVLELDEVNNLQSNSYDEISDFILSELNTIIPNLPVDYSEVPAGIQSEGDPGGIAGNKGRITKGMAMALKSRLLLYAASPLHESTQQEWEAAAQASYELIDSGWYSLESNYSGIYNDPESDELIFGRRGGASSGFERSNFPVGFEGASPGTCPTQNLVDTYEMINGMDIDEPGSGYDTNNPYKDRDPRLMLTVIVNNSEWKDRNVEIWRGGQDGLPLELATETGYYLKKYVEEGVSLDPDAPSSARHTWIFFRLGEVYLNYAEAMNEAYGPDSDPQGYGMTAVESMNVIRNRAGLPDYEGVMTQEAVRQEIRDERRVELAFENHRFWDIRRWDIGDQTTDIFAMRITINQDSTFSYTKTQLENRVWESNYYPIPQSELFKNSNLTQNPGW